MLRVFYALYIFVYFYTPIGPICNYLLLRPQTLLVTLVILVDKLLPPYMYTFSRKSSASFRYVFLQFYAHISIHVYMLFLQYTYTSWYTSTIIILFLFPLLYGCNHRQIYIRLCSYTYIYLHNSTAIRVQYMTTHFYDHIRPIHD
jgi:hypothetical protein